MVVQKSTCLKLEQRHPCSVTASDREEHLRSFLLQETEAELVASH
jgi:hypothetical protein